MSPNNILFTLIILFSITTSGYCSEGKELIGNLGYIDWINMKVVATGEGVPPNNALTPVQAQIMAKRAAVVVARRNLLEVVKGVYIDSTTRVENLILQNDTISTQVKGILQGATVDHVQCQQDGVCKAQVSIPLQGQLAQTLLKTSLPKVSPQNNRKILTRLNNLEAKIQRLESLLTNLEQKQNILIASSAKNNNDNEQLTALKQELLKQNQKQLELEKRIALLETQLSKLQQPSKNQSQNLSKLNLPAYTSLIVDARGVSFRPSLKPELILEEQIIYPGNYVDMNQAIQKGYIRYFRDLNQAQKNELAGNLPYLVKAIDIDADKKSSLILSPDSKEYLLSILNKPDNFLKECRVIIVF